MFKPMLAPGEDPMSYPDYFKKLKYPLFCSPKYDGIRCIVKAGNCLSRTGKILPSRQANEEFSAFTHFDGELIEGNPTDHDVYNRTQSHVMSENKEGNLTFFVFDYTAPDFLDAPFVSRLEHLETLFESKYTNIPNIQVVEHHIVQDYDSLIRYEDMCLSQGFEGIMMKDPLGHYKQGRGTFREGLIYKLKRFTDDEAIVIGFKEQMNNQNTQERDELGYSKRSTMKDNMVPADTLGNFIVDWNGTELDIAPGNFNHEMRKMIWDNPDTFIGQYLKFRYFSHGIKDKPRFPRAIGFRDPIDL